MFNDCVGFLKLVKMNKVKSVTAGIILAEIVWTLKSFYRLSKEDVIYSLQSIHNLHGLDIVDKYNYEGALRIYNDKSVKYIDALISSIDNVSSREWIVISYDKDFDKIGVIRMEPDAVIKKISL